MRLSLQHFLAKKHKEKITLLTAYDALMARHLDQAGVDALLVGDSLGNVLLGYESTVPVTMEIMLHHTKAVVKGSQHAMVIADMPFMSYHVSLDQARKNAGRLIQEGGAQAVKLEITPAQIPIVKALVEIGIPVMGHIGLTPQRVYELGGYKIQGKTDAQAKALLKLAKDIEAAGAFGLVIELVPDTVAKTITKTLTIPTIGIGAGPYCDGQVLVCYDMLGLFGEIKPKFVKPYANLNDTINKATTQFIQDIKTQKFPEKRA